jgi:hypothetical protein
MIFKLYECDVGIKIDGIAYEVPNVVEVQVEDPERNRLTRGNNPNNKVGITFKDGIRDPKKWTMPFMSMSADLKGVLDSAFVDQTRMEVYAISRKDGSSKMAKNAVLSNRPQQLTLDDSAESMHVSLEFESFDLSEVHKS